jgi:dihydroorotate dehydrogenase electron transfer subunit
MWLASRIANTRINLLGPWGQAYALAAHTRTLLVLCDTARLPLTLPIIQSMLDQGGRVTLLIRGAAEVVTPLLPLIPIAVEVRNLAVENWLANLGDGVRWADQLCAALPMGDYAPLAHALRTLRFKSDEAFASVFVTSDLICGTGACLACVVPTHDGSYTRACVHGPVMPLTALAR